MPQDACVCRRMSENLQENTHHENLLVVPQPVPDLQVVQRVMWGIKKEALCWLPELKPMREAKNKAAVLPGHQEARNAHSHSSKAGGLGQQVVKKCRPTARAPPKNPCPTQS